MTRKPQKTSRAGSQATRDRRMRAAGLHPVRIWIPDTRSLDFVESCRRQALAVAAHDPAGDEIMRFVANVYEWPEP